MDVYSGLQIKVARVAANLTHRELAHKAGIGIATLRSIEANHKMVTCRYSTLKKILNTLAEHGIEIQREDSKFIWYKNIELSQPNVKSTELK